MKENGIIRVGEIKLPTKSEVSLEVGQIVEQVREGNVNALQAYGALVAVERIAAAARVEIAEQALTEAESYGKREFGLYGAQFQVSECGVKYDFSQDGEWQSYQDQLEEIRALQKGREETLKRLKQCSKSSTTTIKVQLNK